MAASPCNSEGLARGARMLRTALGPAIASYLDDAGIVEVMLTPDGRLWIDRLSEGVSDTGERLSAADGERIVRLVAHHVCAEVHAGAPRVSAELPETGERFEGLLPPVVAAPAFERKGIVAELDQVPAAATVIALHPAVLARYEEQLNQLQAGLAKGIVAGDAESAEAMRDLIETVTVFRDPLKIGGIEVEIAGRLTALLGENAFPNGVKAVGGKVVAGEGLEPPTPGL
ncbi:hypothetical protein MESS4_830178 [Mesorhizobium sp. STM 4661]|nr:hypothetical protein MESS4_830178 [Mesorhizobium sp. STM 4661]